MSRIAAIDLGSNTCLLAIADQARPEDILHQEARWPRLSENLGDGGSLDKYAIRRVEDVLREYRAICNDYGVEEAICVATAPLRRCADPAPFLAQINRDFGFLFNVARAKDEATLAYLAAPISDRSQVVIDIGGNSTELSWGTEAECKGALSMCFGTVSLKESFFDRDLGTETAIYESCNAIDEHLSSVQLPWENVSRFVCIAGTASALTALIRNQVEGNAFAAGDCETNSEIVRRWFQQLISMECEERIDQFGLHRFRADVLPIGLLILAKIVEKGGAGKVLLSDKGLRHALLKVCADPNQIGYQFDITKIHG